MSSKLQHNYFTEDVLLPYFSRAHAPLVGVEIGVAAAAGTQEMLRNFPNLTLYCIDPWKHFPGQPFEQGGWSEKDHEAGYATTLSKIEPWKDRVRILRMTSDEAVDLIPEGIDFVYIDGHHEFSQVKKDIANYRLKVRYRGIIGGHDFIQVPDVTHAVLSEFNMRDIRMGDDFVWWTIKEEQYVNS